MKKATPILIVFCVAVMSALAQTGTEMVRTSSGFNAGSKTAYNISAVLGQPFDAIFSGNGYEVSEGVSQAQLVIEEIGATVNEGEAYTENGFNYPAGTEVGTYTDSRYTPHGAQYGYDLLKKLTLHVIKVLICGETVYDGDDNPYATVAVANYCWTQENLRTTHYADAGHTAIARAGVYNAPGYDDVAANENTYGRLYTWWSAVNLPEDGSGTLTPDANGYVQGICPENWHIPTAEEMSALNALSAEDIRTAELWVAPNGNTNSTGFTSLPAGMYNAANGRYEQIHVNTGYWSLANGTTGGVETQNFASLQMPYYCNRPLERPASASDMLSVRCVKN